MGLNVFLQVESKRHEMQMPFRVYRVDENRQISLCGVDRFIDEPRILH